MHFERKKVIGSKIFIMIISLLKARFINVHLGKGAVKKEKNLKNILQYKKKFEWTLPRYQQYYDSKLGIPSRCIWADCPNSPLCIGNTSLNWNGKGSKLVGAITIGFYMYASNFFIYSLENLGSHFLDGGTFPPIA